MASIITIRLTAITPVSRTMISVTRPVMAAPSAVFPPPLILLLVAEGLNLSGRDILNFRQMTNITAGVWPLARRNPLDQLRQCPPPPWPVWVRQAGFAHTRMSPSPRPLCMCACADTRRPYRIRNDDSCTYYCACTRTSHRPTQIALQVDRVLLLMRVIGDASCSPTPSQDATTGRSSTGANANRVGLHCVGIGDF